MISYAVIRDQESDRNVAVVAHDPSLGRAVFKVRDTNSAIDKSLQMYYDRSLVVQEPVIINDKIIIRRRRSVPKDEDYLNNLLDKSVKIPYEVRHLKRVESADKLDTFIDRLAKEQITSKN